MTTKRSPQEEAPSCPNCHRNIEHDLAIEMAYCSACGHPIERPQEDPGDSEQAALTQD